MRALIQRVLEARVDIASEAGEVKVVGQIRQGLLILLGVDASDTEADVTKLMDKCLAYRVFADTEGKMNKSVSDIKGEILLVSQFTLSADTQKGLRPSFSKAAPPTLAEPLYNQAVAHVKQKLGQVQTGIFGADMQVQLVNDGPVTFMLEV